ncbi:MAG TPA: LemA family protein [Dokdonella sp.]|uniref:LemA family protein n=1 Tax=Dokdonella sp. TaxID=2291710 RepID=UPI0025C5BF8E|nr:LemA family protein [Dokdonella sp.]MBX3691345.1 LemA family protein [Dokdonella sp.]MCW5568037.1 LemA family protein [Dokdonella sp.]HNR90956.1 LemA family protein [Dokdonella sp.]
MLVATLVVISLLLLGAVLVFNRLVTDRNQARAAWSDIDVQLTRRYDLTPQLVAAVQAYADYERATLTAVTELRTRAHTAVDLADRARLEDELGRQIERLLVLAESYPDLKASGNFLQLQRDLVAIEDHLQYARRFYNGAVRQLNTRIERFPDLIVARLAGFSRLQFYEAEPAQRSAP